MRIEIKNKVLIIEREWNQKPPPWLDNRQSVEWIMLHQPKRRLAIRLEDKPEPKFTIEKIPDEMGGYCEIKYPK